MRESFKGYVPSSDGELRSIWTNAFFVFDTNLLLLLYKLAPATAHACLLLMERLARSKEVWLPFQVGQEFFNHRVAIISQMRSGGKRVAKEIETGLSRIRNAVAEFRRHPEFNTEDLLETLEATFDSLEGDLLTEAASHGDDYPVTYEEDPILERLLTMFDGRTGKRFDEKKLSEIYKEGETRYDRKIPPGFKDAKKPSPNKFGDLVLWKEILEQARTAKKPFVFVTGDEKGDWWHEVDEEVIGPRPELRQEAWETTKQQCMIYRLDSFLEQFMSGEGLSGNDALLEELRTPSVRPPVSTRHPHSVLEAVGKAYVGSNGYSGITLGTNIDESLNARFLRVSGNQTALADGLQMVLERFPFSAIDAAAQVRERMASANPFLTRNADARIILAFVCGHRIAAQRLASELRALATDRIHVDVGYAAWKDDKHDTFSFERM